MSKRDNLAWQALRDAALVDGDAPPASSETPWYLQVLLGVSAWIAALCLFGFLAALFSNLFSNKPTMVFLGLVTCIGAIALLRSVEGDFFRQIAVPASLVGQALVGIALFDDSQTIRGWLGVVILAGAMYAAGPSRLHRFLCGAAAVVGVCGMFGERHFEDIFIAMPLLAWGAVLLWVNDDDERLTPLAWAVGIGALVVAGFVDKATWQIAHDPTVMRPLASVAATALLPVVALRLASVAGALATRTVQLLVAGALVFAALWLQAPGFAIGIAFALVGFSTDRIAVVALGLAGAVAHLADYYFQLDVTLLAKSGLLVLGGVLVLGLRYAALALEKRA